MKEIFQGDTPHLREDDSDTEIYWEHLDASECASVISEGWLCDKSDGYGEVFNIFVGVLGEFVTKSIVKAYGGQFYDLASLT